MLMRGISARRVSQPSRRAACMSFSAPAGGRTFDGDKRMYNLAFQSSKTTEEVLQDNCSSPPRLLEGSKKTNIMAFYKEQYNEKFGVWYPQAVVVGKPIDTKEVAKRLAKISTVSLADVLAVLAEMPGVLADFMAQGKSVRLEGLGTFRYTLNTDGVAAREEMDFQKQVKAVRVQFTPAKEGAATKGGTQTRALVPTGIEWLKYDGQAATDDGTDPDGGVEEGEDGSFG